MEIMLILVVVAVVIAVAAMLLMQRRSGSLKERFGREYDRVVEEEGGDRRSAEAKLREITKRHDDLEIRELTGEAKARYAERWRDIQLRFVEEPAETVTAADALLDEVAHDLGYPADDEDERLAMLSVDHPGQIENCRTARAVRQGGDDGSIDLLRVAFRSYRALFVVLIEDDSPNQGQEPTAEEVTP